MNHVSIVGNLTADPVLRYTQSGKAVANVIVAVSHRSKANGQWNDVTDGFFTVSCWNALADNVAKSLKKGSRVLVTGKRPSGASRATARSVRPWRSRRITWPRS